MYCRSISDICRISLTPTHTHKQYLAKIHCNFLDSNVPVQLLSIWFVKKDLMILYKSITRLVFLWPLKHLKKKPWYIKTIICFICLFFLNQITTTSIKQLWRTVVCWRGIQMHCNICTDCANTLLSCWMWPQQTETDSDLTVNSIVQ